MLKAVHGVMMPTKSDMEINGSIAVLLELANGFNRDFIVSENTYLHSVILDYARVFMNETYYSW